MATCWRHFTEAQINEVLAQVGFDRRQNYRELIDAFKRHEAAADKTGSLETLLRELPAVVKSKGTFYRKLAKWQEDGPAAILPAAVRNKLMQRHVNGLPLAFVEELWKILVEENQRVLSAAYRSLFLDWLVPGRVIPGYNTDWRGIWSAQHKGQNPPADCPYRPYDYTPEGWSETNLRRSAPNLFERAAARIGRSAASEFLPKLPTTRVGLRFGQCVVIDDVYHDTRLTFAGNSSPQIAVELGALELLSGDYFSWGMKPVRENDDGTREHLKEAFTRYLMADFLCRVGVCAQGCMVAGEHGTAKLPKELIAVIERWLPGLVRFEAGGLRHAPIAKGLFEGRPGGNFRFKAALESHHNLKKNELAQLPGQKGADPEHAPEDLATKTSYHRALVKACVALAETRPDLIEQVRSPFPSYWRYAEAVLLLYERIAHRIHHRLEGFDECGFTVEEYEPAEGHGYIPIAKLLAGKSDEAREAMLTLMKLSPERYNRRVMSPREAFAFCQAQQATVKLPEAAVPELLGRELGDVVKVEASDVLLIQDRYLPNKQYPVAAVVQTKRGTELLDRGTKWLVHLSPFNQRWAYVSTEQEAYVGRAPVLVAGTKVDRTAVQHNLGILSSVEAEELKKLAPLGEKRMREEAAMREHNVRLLSGRDPLEENEAREELRRAGAGRVSAADLAAATQSDEPAAEDMAMSDVARLLRDEE